MFSLGRRIHFALGGSAVATLIAINCAVFFVVVVGGRNFGGTSLDWWLASSLPGLVEWYGLGALRLVTSLFTHSFENPYHLLGNMLILYYLGRMAEAEVGVRGLFHLYLASGLAADVVSLSIHAVTGEYAVRGIGASGACYGIMVYAALMAPRTIIRLFFLIPVQLGPLVAILVALGWYSSVMQIHGVDESNIGHTAHLGGAVGGFVAFRWFRGYYLALGTGRGAWFPGLARWRKRRAQQSQQDRQFRLDEILDKVQREGIHALSPDERRYLERASKDLRGR